MKWRTWNTTGLYKANKDRPRTGRSRRTGGERTAGSAVLVPHDFRQDQPQRLPETPWQVLMLVARRRRNTLRMLGRSRRDARHEAIDGMGEDRRSAELGAELRAIVMAHRHPA